MKYALLTTPLLIVGCAAFQTGATPEDAAAAEEQIIQGGTLLAPFVGPFAPFVPLAAGIAVQIGRLIRNKK
jgi:hypothetical protein